MNINECGCRPYEWLGLDGDRCIRVIPRHYGILTLADGNDGASVLLCVKEGNYYIFDSHSRDVFGNVVPNGTSVLLHMRTHNAFMKYIKTLGCQLAASQFEITVLSPSVSGFHRMLRQTPTSQKSQNEQSKQNIENKSSEIKRTSCRSTKQQNKEKKEHSQTTQNTEHMQKIQKKSSETRRITRNSTEEQNKEVKQHSDSLRHIKDINDKSKNKEEQKKNRKKEYYENKKRKILDNRDEQLETSAKKRKSPQIEKDTSSHTILNRYNTRSRKREENAICTPIQSNSSQSNKRKQTRDDNIVKRRRTIRNKNTNKNKCTNENTQNDDINNISSQEEIDNINTNIQTETINMDESLKLFNIKISNGPIYICTVCLQTWFRRSVLNIEFLKVCSEAEEEKLNQCRRHYVSVEDKEWICKTCRDSIKMGKIPKLSLENKMGFPPQPKELKLNGMEERFTAPRLTLFQMRDLPCGGQKSVRGNSVNLPIDIAPTVDMLPRTLDNTETIAINYKRRLCYKGCAFKQENIRPAAVWKAVKYLMTHSQMYKDLDIQLDTSWIRNMESCDSGTCQCVQDNTENSSQPPDVHQNNEENNENIDNIEEDEDLNNINRDTMLSAPESVPRELTFAPGEGQHPISVFHDPDAEYLSFPTVFCGQRRASDKERTSSVHYTEICKYELRSVDRRVATNVPNMFFKLKKVQMKHVLDRVSLAMRRVKGKGIRAKNVLDDESRAQLVRLDEGYYIFRNLHNSPAYLEKRKKDAFAMIRQIGFPSLFISLSAAETKWPELLRAVGQLNDNKTYTDEEIAQMDTQKIFGLIRKDSATVVRYFHHRFVTFLHDVLRSTHNPIGEISDYFWRFEFAKRGAIHVHWFAYLKDAPVYGEDDDNAVITYYDKIISCSSDIKPEYSNYIKYQIHRHTKSCLRGRRKKCRFGFPQPPMPKTIILEPFAKDDEEVEEIAKQNWKRIKRMLDDFKLGEEVTMTFDEMLQELNINLTEYLAAVQTTIVRTKMFFQRRPSEIRMNNYMKNCLQFWRANHDIQPSIEPYGMVKYILSYVTKGQKGMSVVMEKACREARNGNMDLKQSVRHMGNAFLNGVETSQEEAACLLLGIPITEMSREVFFINTAPIDERTFVLKSMEQIKKMDPESTDVMSSNALTAYKQRSQKHFSNYTLADFVSEITISFPNTKAREDYYEANTDDYPLEEMEDENSQGQLLLQLRNGTKFIKRSVPRIIRYVNYNRDKDPENYFRERLMLFYPWKNETTDLKGIYNTFQASYRAHKQQIVPIQKKYERYNDILEEAVEEADANPDTDDEEDDTSQQETITNLPDYAYFDPQRDERLLTTDIGNDMGLSLRYDNEVDLFGTQMDDKEYEQIMRSLNRRQSEILIHVMEQLTNTDNKMYIFLEGGAGVGKTQVANALNASINRLFRKSHTEDPNGNYTMVLAPTGIAAYHVKGNTLHSGLHININTKELSSLNGDALARLQQKYINVKVLFLEEVSMIGRELMKKVNKRLQQIFGTMSIFGNLHVIAIGDFYQMAPVQDSYVFSEHYRRNLRCLHLIFGHQISTYTH